MKLGLVRMSGERVIGIKVLNEIVRIQNSIVRKKQRELDREINYQINQMFIQAYKSVIKQ